MNEFLMYTGGLFVFSVANKIAQRYLERVDKKEEAKILRIMETSVYIAFLICQGPFLLSIIATYR